jgi:trans-aconitate methyltransferase
VTHDAQIQPHEAGANAGYERFHAPRHAYLISVLDRIGIRAGTRVLDIGSSRLTEMIRDRFGVRVDTLGFQEDSRGDAGNHFHFDLNDSQHEERWRRDLGPYDVVVFAEVIEHLYTAPELVLAFVRTLVAPGGALVIQTPNAASAAHRIKLLIGRNPYERIRLDSTNPGHFREYTIPELRAIVQDAGFRVESVDARFYFDARYAHHGAQPRYQPVIGRLKNTVFAMLPKSLRLGTTMVARRAG